MIIIRSSLNMKLSLRVVRFQGSSLPSIVEERDDRRNQSEEHVDSESSCCQGHKHEQIIYIPSLSDLSQECKQRLWLTPAEFENTRSAARMLCKESERNGHSKRLNCVYGSCLQPTYCVDYDDDDDELHRDALAQATIQEQLNAWVVHGHSHRGLERWANPLHGKIRRADQQMYVRKVLRMQQKEPSSEVLREAAHKLSERSRLFAEMMGKADALAAEAASTQLQSVPCYQPLKNFQISGRRNLGLNSTRSSKSLHRTKQRPGRLSMVA